MKKIFLTALTLCATTLFADESFGGIGLVVRGYDRYTGARQLWEFVVYESKNVGTDEENEK